MARPRMDDGMMMRGSVNKTPDCVAGVLLLLLLLLLLLFGGIVAAWWKRRVLRKGGGEGEEEEAEMSKVAWVGDYVLIGTNERMVWG